MNVKKKILITGAGGFIGSNLVRLLVKEEGAERLRLMIYHKESMINLPSNVQFDVVVGDIRDKKIFKAALKDVDIIYHLAAVTRDGDGRYIDVNYNGTRNLINACKSRNIRKFVFFSSIAIYGLPAFVGDNIGVNENSPIKAIGEYAKSKYLSEKLLINANKDWGLPCAIVRPTTVYGPRDKAGIYQLYNVIKNGYFVRLGKGDNKVDYVYVDDLVAGARLAEKSNYKTGDYILGSSKAITFKSLVNNVALVARKPISKLYISKDIAIVFASFISTIGNLLKIKLPISADRVRVMNADYNFSIMKARREIMYNPRTSFKEGMKKTALWIESFKKYDQE